MILYARGEDHLLSEETYSIVLPGDLVTQTALSSFTKRHLHSICVGPMPWMHQWVDTGSHGNQSLSPQSQSFIPGLVWGLAGVRVKSTDAAGRLVCIPALSLSSCVTSLCLSFLICKVVISTSQVYFEDPGPLYLEGLIGVPGTWRGECDVSIW